MGVILVTHDLGVVAQSCDRVAVMYAGRIVETGPVAALFAEPHHAYTRGLLGSVPRAGGERRPLLSIDGTPPGLGARPPGCAFHPRCGFATDRLPPRHAAARRHRAASAPPPAARRPAGTTRPWRRPASRPAVPVSRA